MDAAANRLRHPREILGAHRHTLQVLDHRLAAALPTLLGTTHRRLHAAAYRLTHPGAEIATRRARLAMFWQRLESPLPARLREGALRLETLGARLEAVSYASVLARGFALVTNAKGAPVSRTTQVKANDALKVRFADGEISVSVTMKQGLLL
jgi:exodeoxyribonuclease VII large subunit